jgi:hypothetical protein
MRAAKHGLVLAALGILLAFPAVPLGAQQAVTPVPNPAGRDMFRLDDLESYRQFSQVKNFEIVGHGYFRGPWVVPGGAGTGINTLRICGTIAYLAGYNPTVFGALIVDVSDPAKMEPLSFIAGNPGTRNAYLRVDCGRKVLALGHSASPENPNKAVGGALKSGVTFHDVSDPRRPVKLAEYNNPGQYTHGMEMDPKHVYLCGTGEGSKPRAEELHIIDYENPRAPKLAASFHVMGQRVGETFSEMNQKNPNGTDQWVTCHEAIKDGSRLYLAYRDAGVIILDVADPTKPAVVGEYDYVPPFNGDPGLPRPGCCPGAHTAAPVPHAGQPYPSLLVLTDEHFSCPPGFVRILDVTNPRAMQVLSTIHIAGVDDRWDQATGKFVCPPGQQSSHLPFFEPRSHGSLFYQAWYDQGLRAFDISNPFSPKEVGYFISPDTSIPTQVGRHTREAYVDPATNLIYVTDGNGGGLTVLRYTGPMPQRPPIPGAR